MFGRAAGVQTGAGPGMTRATRVETGWVDGASPELAPRAPRAAVRRLRPAGSGPDPDQITREVTGTPCTLRTLVRCAVATDSRPQALLHSLAPAEHFMHCELP